MLNTVVPRCESLVEFASFAGPATVPDLFVPRPFDMPELAGPAQPFVNANRSRSTQLTMARQCKVAADPECPITAARTFGHQEGRAPVLDFGSLLLATALSGACLSGTLVAIWLTARQSRFVLTMAVGILLLVTHVIAFWLYGRHASSWLGQGMLALLVAGFFVVFTSADQYIERGWSKPATLPIIAIIALTVVVTAAGFDGVGFVIAYLAVTGILVMTATAFWTSTEVDRRVLAPVSLLTGSSAISFALCAFVIIRQKQWVLGSVPRNWAEDVNTVVVVACMTALGALTISFHHLRTQSRLTEETLTDPLTGLMNRRALNSLHANTSFGQRMALAMVDLDHFKRTNDVFGHAVGDRVLQRFADIVRRQSRQGVEGFRLGGEEFAIVISGMSTLEIYEVLRKIGASFGAEVVATKLGPLRSTVSAGVCFGSDEARSLEQMLLGADVALYAAKRAGRNRVATAGPADCDGYREPQLLFA
ncbi:GGDEF domain-containing protein [Aminobacter sp. NyZ550]|uniref:GGDEF domain-containing protein n=1 Tax=Aminobacter sp. NyZ550 TaxID=2979870 RepID=UPI0021D578A2|nr:GGDEF domain-containing protein [Aminobacter sp. NyZ550]WAX93299.1 GGDEF domain-containing protein [Aminobacter sp. NyZ550]